MHYAIYLPGLKGSNPEHLANVGLAGIGVGAEYADIEGHAPDGGHGAIAVWRSGDGRTDSPLSAPAYQWDPAKACKRRKLAAKRFWFGIIPEHRPEPKDLERKIQHLGYGIEMLDGNVWTIPAAVNLPHHHGLNGDGEFTRHIADEHKSFWDASERYAVEFFQAIDQLEFLRAKRPNSKELTVSFTLADSWGFCCQAIALNYRLTPELIDFLKLMGDVEMRNTIKAAIDLPCILEDRDQKKMDEVTIPVG